AGSASCHNSRRGRTTVGQTKRSPSGRRPAPLSAWPCVPPPVNAHPCPSVAPPPGAWRRGHDERLPPRLQLSLSSLPARMHLADHARLAVTADDRGARLALQRPERAANLHDLLLSWRC